MNVSYMFMRYEQTFLKGLSVCIVCLMFLLVGTCSHQHSRPDATEREILKRALLGLSSEYSQPRLVSGELVVNINDVALLSGDSLIAHNHKLGIPEQTPPSLRMWSADILDYPSQKLITETSKYPQADTIYTEDEYANRILFWDLSSQLIPGVSFSINRKFKYLTYDYRPSVDLLVEKNGWATIPGDILEKYTRDEAFLEQDQVLVDTVLLLLDSVIGPVQQARVLYDWVQGSMTYVYPPEERGVRNAFKTRQGDCGQYSALFITMARIAGIPARQQSGFNFYPGNTGAHVWSEIYLPVKGWVPVDATREDGFLHLDNRRLIISTGLNIPIEFAPDWANNANSEVEAGKTDFMQMYTLISSGMTADFSSERHVLRSVELK